jgi:hypothetical protein
MCKTVIQKVSCTLRVRFGVFSSALTDADRESLLTIRLFEDQVHVGCRANECINHGDSN